MKADQPLTLGTVLLEEQRNRAWTEFRDKLPRLADEQCRHRVCMRFGTGLGYSAAFAGLVQPLNPASERWPPYNRVRGLRVSLETAHNQGDVTVKFFPGCAHPHDDTITVKGEAVRNLCHQVSKIACGLCLTCLEENSTVDEHFKHRASLELWVENDSLIQ